MEVAEASTLHCSIFDQIPNEVTARIFYQGTESWKEALDFAARGRTKDRTRTVPFPDLVSGVCKHWRALAQSTPELWTQIQPPTAEGCIAWMSNWFERSKALPVAVILDNKAWARNTNRRDPLSETIVFEILDFVELFAHRLHRFDIRVEFVPVQYISRILGKATGLQQLSLCQTYTSVPFIGTPHTEAVFHTSNSSWLEQLTGLQRLRYQGLPLPYTPQLTCLEVHKLNLPFADISVLFGDNCRLKYLILPDLYPIIPSIALSGPRTRVNSLQFIAVSNNKSPSLRTSTYLFSCLDMPNVTYLELDLDTSIFGVFGQSLSSSKIHTLRIRNALPIVREAENEDTNVLRSFSSLQSLELIRVSAKTLLDRFIASSGGKFPNRKPSMGSIIDSNGRPPAVLHAKSKGSEDSLEAVWPKLHTISLDTMLADDVVSLISFITYHKGIRSLNLSYLAMRHLRFLRRKGNKVITSPPIILSGRGSPFEEDKDIGTADVEEWLSVMVHLDLMEDTLDLESLLPSTKEVPLVQLP